MVKKLEIYKCEVCGNIVEVVTAAAVSWYAAENP